MKTLRSYFMAARLFLLIVGRVTPAGVGRMSIGLSWFVARCIHGLVRE